jgi:ribosome-associated protein
MTEASEKKDVQKLQRVIVDSLEDVKAQDIQAFNTEHLSALFERVIIACGTSNRQTKALAASVRDEVREAGFGKPRIEGEENGEWIIVDCGSVVVHIMQPTIRQYYHLEEIWGDKPVRLKLGADKPRMPVKIEPTPEPSKKVAKKSAVKTSRGKTAATSKPTTTSAKKTPRPAAKSATKPAAKTSSKPAKKPAVKKVVVNKPPAKKMARQKTKA